MITTPKNHAIFTTLLIALRPDRPLRIHTKGFYEKQPEKTPQFPVTIRVERVRIMVKARFMPEA
jgi:hypothetical protein